MKKLKLQMLPYKPPRAHNEGSKTIEVIQESGFLCWTRSLRELFRGIRTRTHIFAFGVQEYSENNEGWRRGVGVGNTTNYLVILLLRVDTWEVSNNLSVGGEGGLNEFERKR